MKKAFNLLLALFPILSGYGFSPSLDFGILLLFIFGVACYFLHSNQFKLKLPLGFALFFFVALILSLLWARSVPLRLLLFTVTLCFACSYANWKKLWKYYVVIVWICVGFFIIQEGCYYILGSRPSGIMPFIPTIYGERSSAIILGAMHGQRSASFFLEPSYFAQFLIPYTVICLFSNRKRERNFAILISIIIVLVRSGMGVLLLGIIWIFWALYSDVKLGYKIVVVIGALGLVFLIFYTSSTVSDLLLGRSEEMFSYTGEEKHQSSGFIRFFRGYYLFADIPFLNQLMGSHPQVIQDIIRRNVFFGVDAGQFLNGAQTLLLYNGFIGALLYLRHILLYPIITHSKLLLVFSLCVILLMFGESIYLSSRLFLITILMQLIFRGSNQY